MALARVWDEEWSPSEEYGRHLEVVKPAETRFRTGRPVSRRRDARERMMRRRRRALLVVGLVISAVILAWPGHAFGGVTGTGLSANEASSSQLSAGMVYVVQPGQTVDSIARLMNPWNPSIARHVLIRELGSSDVVAGEHVLIP